MESDEPTCSECGARLIWNQAERGSCPACVMALALDAAGRDESAAAAATSALDAEARIGESVGPYRLVEILGEGGMGVVYLARQARPIERDVAVKVIKLGMDTAEVLARFENERQVLAMLDHPNVSRVIDAGATRRGRPYFVMEYVEGLPITTYADIARLNLRERIELFLQVCSGIRHAHRHGIIHRDIKPTNILVTERDEGPLAKIIDFGVAKATAAGLAHGAAATRAGRLIGTPEYMSPEQARLVEVPVDTRSDVYSLGLVLYELLVGALPIDREDAPDLDSLLWAIREHECPRPSSRAGRGGARARTAARKRGTDPATLARRLRGELDWIVMRALEKEPDRRYATVEELAKDLRRFLRQEPVLAGPPSATYRLRKLVLRHRVAAGLASLALVTLVAFAVTMAAQAGRLKRERDLVRQEAETARAVSGFLTELFEIAGPDHAQGADVPAREILDEGARRIEALSAQPRVQARLMAAMGVVYEKLGLYERAEDLIRKALERRRLLLGPEAAETLESQNDLGRLLWRRGRFEEAEAQLTAALDVRRRRFGAADPALQTIMSNLGLVYWRQGRYRESESLQLDVWTARRRALGEDHPETLSAMNNLMALYRHQGRLEEAVDMGRRVLEARRRVLGDSHPHTLVSMDNLASLLLDVGKPEQAEDLWTQALATQRRVLGERHPETLRSMNNVGSFHESMGDYGGAETLFAAALEGQLEVLGEGHPGTLATMTNLAALALATGRLERAEALYRRVLGAREHTLGPDHADTLRSANNLAVLYRDASRFDEAERLFRRALDGRRATLGEDHPDTLTSMSGLGRLYRRQGRLDEARSLLRAVAEGRRRALGPDHVRTRQAEERLASLEDEIAAASR